MSKNNIPSEEDFRRAEIADRERQKGLSEVRDHILNRFSKEGVYNFFILFSPEKNYFGAFVFYRWDKQITEAKESGLSSKIVSAVYEELEKAGRGTRSTIEVEFEFDSHENVERNYEGDYYMRLR
ncbi:MAG: hypothetical protein GY714_00055 [Desulfobacterales bacterium]|nr:hypothetical protein [Desulfobacterales bacterium]